MRKRRRGRLGWALVTSAVVHGGGLALLWVLAGSAEPLPRMRVYAVDIVSPAPQLAGPPNPGNGAEPTVEETPAEPEPTAPEPEPQPALPQPAQPGSKPTPAKPAREPSPAPQATKTPEPAKPAAKPPEPKPEPKKSAGGGTGGGSGASTGTDPDPDSPGGEGIDLRLRGMQCPSPEYCANIIRQLYRYFRPPAGSAGEAEVFFYVNRDGSASDIRILKSSGSFQFRSAAMEAVEQAGLNRAFGALPRSFSVDRLPVSFFFRPAR